MARKPRSDQLSEELSKQLRAIHEERAEKEDRARREHKAQRRDREQFAGTINALNEARHFSFEGEEDDYKGMARQWAPLWIAAAKAVVDLKGIEFVKVMEVPEGCGLRAGQLLFLEAAKGDVKQFARLLEAEISELGIGAGMDPHDTRWGLRYFLAEVRDRIQGAPGAPPKKGLERPRTPAENKALAVLRSLKPGNALTGPRLAKEMGKGEDRVIISEDRLRKEVIPVLKKHFGVKNTRRVGYWIPKDG